jgi:hypothetical protein
MTECYTGAAECGVIISLKGVSSRGFLLGSASKAVKPATPITVDYASNPDTEFFNKFLVTPEPKTI